jgi:hypothetical protein
MSLPSEVIEAQKNGAVAVCAIPCIGPHTNAAIISLQPRAALLDTFFRIRNFTRYEKKGFVRNLTSAIKTAILDETEPHLNLDLMGDIPLLLVIHLIEQKKQNLDRSGLRFIGLAINEDETLHWRERGMLDHVLLDRMGVDTTPMYM